MVEEVTLPPEKGKNITYWYEDGVLKKDKLIKKSTMHSNSDALKTWAMMREHLKDVRATYANLPRQDKNHPTRMKLHNYELRVMDYLKKLEGIIKISFVEYQDEWELTATGY